MSIETLTLVLLGVVLIQTSYLTFHLVKRIRPQRSNQSIFVDTSVLIDGRILMVAETGFIGGTLIIPRSVIGELQFLADNSDHEKRARARHGLDVVKKLQDLKMVQVEILQDGNRPAEGVDDRLLNLAKKHGGSLLTIDYNLNKVAAVEDIQILNINELAQKLRMSHLPGERLTIELIQPGQDNHQGVGYLPDGTMVVVEQAGRLIGKKVEVEFIRALQTAAGKMMFARLTNPNTKRATDKSPARRGKPQNSPQKASKNQPRRQK